MPLRYRLLQSGNGEAWAPIVLDLGSKRASFASILFIDKRLKRQHLCEGRVSMYPSLVLPQAEWMRGEVRLTRSDLMKLLCCHCARSATANRGPYTAIGLWAALRTVWTGKYSASADPVTFLARAVNLGWDWRAQAAKLAAVGASAAVAAAGLVLLAEFGMTVAGVAQHKPMILPI